MMRTAFTLGYRRYEWKCNALNAASRAAAERLGFSYEGIFRQARVDKGRNRDTAWYAAIDREWPAAVQEPRSTSVVAPVIVPAIQLSAPANHGRPREQPIPNDFAQPALA